MIYSFDLSRFTAYSHFFSQSWFQDFLIFFSLNKFESLFLIIFLWSCTPNTPRENIKKPEPVQSEPVTLIFAGDVMHHMPQMYAAYVPETNLLDYTPCFQYIKTTVQKADLAFCNLETSLGGKPFSGYPRFSAPDELLYALKETGFDVIQMANNHVLDRGSRGLERAIELIRNEGMHHVGAYVNQDQHDTHYPLMIDIKGIKIAVLNVTYGTNGLIVKKPNVVNVFDSLQVLSDIRKARELSADIIIMLAHWGYEYHLYSNADQDEIAGFCVGHGVDLIIGSHPHVVQNVRFIENKEKGRLVPVFYSLGNFISNQTDIYRNGGLLAHIKINKDKKYISAVSITPLYVFKGSVNHKRQYYLIPSNDFLKNTANYPIPSADSVSVVQFHNDIKRRLKNVMIENE